MIPGELVRLIKSQGYLTYWPDVSEWGDNQDNPVFRNDSVAIVLQPDPTGYYSLLLFSPVPGAPALGWVQDECLERI